MKQIFTLILLAFSITSYAQRNPTVSTTVVISQIYGGAGCGTAGCSTWQNDYIELHNVSGSAVDLTGYSVQYSSATGGSWTNRTNLPSVTLQPGEYYLIAEGAGANGVSAIPTPDATGSIAMSATAGKIALVNNTTALTGSCPTGAGIVDFVGYGTTANCYEGTGPASAPSTTNAIFRNSNGCSDTDDNAADFTAAPAVPRNSATPVSPCGPVPIILQSFSATKTTATNKISWQVNCLSASVTFELERSVNARVFVPIYRLNATQAQCASAFYYDDNSPVAGANYYRLKIIDVDSKFSYSDTKLIVNKTNSVVINGIMPTIVDNDASIDVASSIQTKIDWVIIDMQGKTVQKFSSNISIGENRITLTTPFLSKGLYKVIPYISGEKGTPLSFVKQ
jgi:hypothetical protein